MNQLIKIFFVSTLIFILPFTALPPSFALSAKTVNTGNRLYTRGQYEEAIKKYQEALNQDSESDIVNFNIGAALYKDGQYDEGKLHFQKSLLSDDPSLVEKARYNLGNTFYRSGIKNEDTNLPAAIQSLEQSLSFFEDVLANDPNHEDAQYNYDFVKKELERLKKKQQQQQAQQNQQQQNQQQQNQQQAGQQQQNQEQAGQQEEQDQQQANQQQQQQQQDQPPQQQQAAADQSHEEISRNEARMMLEDYQQNEEPKGLLNFNRGRRSSSTVFKDW